jgi:response regulator NasT
MRILVADDEPASAQSLKELLELVGHQVIGPAANGVEAVRLAGSEHPDLAIPDIEMPLLSGFDAIVQITRTRPIPVIVLTGHSSPDFVERAEELPVFNYLCKPAGSDRLLPAIRIATARFREWSALHGQVSDLARKMEERKTIERAKGILMQLRGLSEDEAYRLLQRQSQQRGRSMVGIARGVIAAQGGYPRLPRAAAGQAPA